MNSKSSFLFLFLIAPLLVRSQAFTETDPGIIGINQGDVTWVDYDNDGDLDIFLFGNVEDFTYDTRLYQNNSGTFTEVFPGIFPDLVIGDCDWGDYDNDGDMDLAISASVDSSPGTGSTKIYNNSSGSFVEVNEGEISDFIGSVVAWGDFDRDGDLDLAIGGEEALPTSNNPRDIEIYQNNNNVFERIYVMQHTGVMLGSADWGDYDKDGDLDLLVTGYSSGNASARTAHVIDNTPTGFVRNEDITMIGVAYGEGNWGDYDKDGDLDIIVNGSTYENENLDRLTQIYQNTNGSFQPVLANTIIGSEEGQASWGDYDEDGDLDVVVIGRTTSDFSEYVARLYEYKDNTYTSVEDLSSGVGIGTVKWGDYDNDGDLDIILSGQVEATHETITRIYVNNRKSSAFATNQPPSAPANLRTEISATEVKLAWDKSSDAETDVDGLSYNIYVRLESDTIFSAQSRTSGLRKIVHAGNAGALTQFTFPRLSGGTYHWSVQAIDNSFSGSAFAAEASFELTDQVITGATRTDDHHFIVYPIPVVDNISISMKNNITGNVGLTLLNLQGQEIYFENAQKENFDFSHTIHRGDLPPGMYFLAVTQNGGPALVKKIIIGR
jgi:hypothetical protein